MIWDSAVDDSTLVGLAQGLALATAFLVAFVEITVQNCMAKPSSESESWYPRFASVLAQLLASYDSAMPAQISTKRYHPLFAVQHEVL